MTRTGRTGHSRPPLRTIQAPCVYLHFGSGNQPLRQRQQEFSTAFFGKAFAQAEFGESGEVDGNLKSHYYLPSSSLYITSTTTPASHRLRLDSSKTTDVMLLAGRTFFPPWAFDNMPLTILPFYHLRSTIYTISGHDGAIRVWRTRSHFFFLDHPSIISRDQSLKTMCWMIDTLLLFSVRGGRTEECLKNSGDGRG